MRAHCKGILARNQRTVTAGQCTLCRRLSLGRPAGHLAPPSFHKLARLLRFGLLAAQMGDFPIDEAATL